LGIDFSHYSPQDWNQGGYGSLKYIISHKLLASILPSMIPLIQMIQVLVFILFSILLPFFSSKADNMFEYAPQQKIFAI